MNLINSPKKQKTPFMCDSVYLIELMCLNWSYMNERDVRSDQIQIIETIIRMRISLFSITIITVQSPLHDAV